ncbi:hypothetical protein K3725_04340 [Leisingera sp. S132]|uniref:hypothetical protein n=1 Tax=Leisingera sp. S132 TaxID=2867016 RepID=UPI0021A3108C|nr:hypothetical protein [Leisingera sp. S132]UWQ80248.1 hypothetical protein K3725_04340 [Leisingera sp. S132]
MKPALLLAALTAALAAGCARQGLGPDAYELANIKGSNIVPKSSPTAFVKAFDKFCAKGPADPQSAERLLRASSYVPLPRKARNGGRVYVVDDRRPAVAVSSRGCMVQSYSRTGQTERVRRYVAETFPAAVRVPEDQLRRHKLEEAWIISGDQHGIVATRRTVESGNHSNYALVLYRTNGPVRY